jgi:tetratricopeptide (TPR) repeat protein
MLTRSLFCCLLMVVCPAMGSAQTAADVRVALESGNPAEARRLFEALAANSAPDEAAWRSVASQIFRAGAVDDAVALLDQAASRFPSDPRFPYLAGYVLAESGRCAEALPQLERSIYIAPTADASWSRANCLAETSQDSAAGDEFARYLSLEDRPEKASQVDVARGRASVAAPATMETGPIALPVDGVAAGVEGLAALPMSPIPPPTGEAEFPRGEYATLDEARAAGLAAAANRNWDRAALAFGSVVDFAPTDADGWYRLGVCQALIGRTSLALAAFERARSADPAMGIAARRSSQAQARLEHEQRSALDPAGFAWSSDARDQAAMIAAEQGLWLAAGRASWSANPDAPTLAAAVAARGEGDSGAALEAALHAIARDPHLAELWVAGAEHARLVDIELSAYLLNTAVELGSDSELIELIQADLQLRRTRAERAGPEAPTNQVTTDG